MGAVFKISSSLISEERVGSSCFLVLRIDVQETILAAFSPRGLYLFTPTSNKRNFELDTSVVTDVFSQILLAECGANEFQDLSAFCQCGLFSPVS